jgi:hypothetical protein
VIGSISCGVILLIMVCWLCSKKKEEIPDEEES